MEISAVGTFVSSQSTRVTDRQTDTQDRANVAASSGKNRSLRKTETILANL